MSEAPPAAVLDAFMVPGRRPIALEGGEGRSWRAGDLVMKPAPAGSEWAWLGEHLPTVREDGFRLALPTPSRDDRWVVDGWCAQTWVAGSHPSEPRWLDVLGVGERLHSAMRHLPRPPFVDERTHAYSIGDRVAWGEMDSPVRHGFLARLVALRRDIEAPPQAIHGDLTENVLFAHDAAPAVIDLAVYWRPAGYAGAVVVGDAIRWANADPAPLFDATSHVGAFAQLFVRAAIFRLVTSLVFDRGGIEPFASDVTLAERLVGT